MLHVTGIGAIAIPIGLFLFFLNSRWLLRLTVFFIPFNATSAFEAVGAGSSIGIRLSVYFGFLWLLRLTINQLARAMPPFKLEPAERILLLFIFACCMSFTVPILSSSSLMVYVLDTQSYSSLRFGLNNILGLFYITFGIIFSLCVASHGQSPPLNKELLKVHVVSLVIVSIIGLVEVGSFYFNFNYPFYFLNNTSEYSSLADSRRILHEIGLMRMASVADEPSILAQSVLIGIASLLPWTFVGGYLISRVFDRLFLWTLFIALLLTGSASGYLGLIVLISASAVVFLKSRAVSRAAVAASAAILIFGTWFSVTLVEGGNQYMQVFFLAKGVSDSGLERVDSIYAAWASFLDSPFVGVGWASVTSFDLWVLLLSNVGVLGAGVFLSFMLVVVYGLWVNLNNANVRVAALSQVSIILFTSYWATASIAGWSFQFMTSFFVIGIALASIKQGRNSSGCDRSVRR